jgi:hypothetical protein
MTHLGLVSKSLGLLLLFAAQLFSPALAGSNDDDGCVYGNGAITSPSIPKALILAQSIGQSSKTASTYSAILKSGLVVLSTHMACEHYGADVLLTIPSGLYDREMGVSKQLSDLLIWYVGRKNTKEILSKIKNEKLVEGWRKDIPNASEEFPNVTIGVHREGETYIVIELYYFSDLG